ncbi:hypothetical protein HUU40_05435 [candidate division KSB1 bacterium]|nr:hypothetical protein [candidate division KSB1 bacterium]
MSDFTTAELKSWITKLHDPRTTQEELKRIVMELAHANHPEALQALEQFRESPRANEVEWIEHAIDESTYFVLDPKNEREEKDYMRVELWQEYEEELYDKMAQRDAAEVHKQQLKVEKEFLEKAMAAAPNASIRVQIMARHSGIDFQIAMAENDRMNLEEEIAGLEFIVAQIEKAVESPLYRTHGKREIGVHFHRDCEAWLKKRRGLTRDST